MCTFPVHNPLHWQTIQFQYNRLYCKHCILGNGLCRALVDCFTFKRLSYHFKFLDMIAFGVRHSYLLTTVSLYIPMDSALLYHFRMGIISTLFIFSMIDHYKDIRQSKGIKSKNKYFQYDLTQSVIIMVLMISASCYLIWLFYANINLNMFIPLIIMSPISIMYKWLKRRFQFVGFKNMMNTLVTPCVYVSYYLQLQEKHFSMEIFAWSVSIWCIICISHRIGLPRCS
eukprot:1137995_1